MAALSTELDELQASLERRFRVTETRVEVGARSFAIRHPASAEELATAGDVHQGTAMIASGSVAVGASDRLRVFAVAS